MLRDFLVNGVHKILKMYWQFLKIKDYVEILFTLYKNHYVGLRRDDTGAINTQKEPGTLLR